MSLQIRRNVYEQIYGHEVDFLVFSGTALSTIRFVSSSVTKANRSPIMELTLITVSKVLGNWGIFKSDIPQF